MAVSSLILPASARGFDPDEERQKLFSQFDMEELDKQCHLFQNRILVTKWIRDRDGSIHIAESTKREDSWQGKVGLVLKVGPVAFTDDDNNRWFNQRAKVGDWVLYHYSDGIDFNYRVRSDHKQVQCKLLREGDIAMVVPRPDFAW